MLANNNKRKVQDCLAIEETRRDKVNQVKGDQTVIYTSSPKEDMASFRASPFCMPLPNVNK